MNRIWRSFMRLCRRGLTFIFKSLGKDLTTEQWQVWEQFIKFALVGCSNSLVCLVVCYFILFCFGEGRYLFGQTLGYIAAVFNSFFWNSKYVFSNHKGNKKIAFGKMCVCNVVVYMLQMGALYLLVDIMAVSEWSAPVLAILIALPVNFLLNKLIAFR